MSRLGWLLLLIVTVPVAVAMALAAALSVILGLYVSPWWFGVTVASVAALCADAFLLSGWLLDRMLVAPRNDDGLDEFYG
jgi:hypothetical protein